MDLFENYEEQPQELKEICDKYDEIFNEGSIDVYEICLNFLEEVEVIGYTFEYGLDGCPYALRKIGEELIEE